MCSSKSPYVRAKQWESTQEKLGTILGYIIGYPFAIGYWLAIYVCVPVIVLAIPVLVIASLFG